MHCWNARAHVLNMITPATCSHSEAIYTEKKFGVKREFMYGQSNSLAVLFGLVTSFVE